MAGKRLRRLEEVYRAARALSLTPPVDDDWPEVRHNFGSALRAVGGEGLLDRPYPPTPNIVTLCGSTRFHAAFVKAAYEETMRGSIVLSVGFYRADLGRLGEEPLYESHGERVGCTADEKVALDELHKRKIDLADEVLVLNVGGYVGESTRREIAYAESIGTPIRYLEAV